MEKTIGIENPIPSWVPTAEPIGLYFHVPFCETRCPYCDFNTYARIESLIPGFTDALCDALRLWGQSLGRPRVGTVFFGGGTPSYVGAANIARVLRAAGDAFNIDTGAEISLEANPGDLNAEALASLRRAGATRLSMGVQSLDDRLLRLLGRRHTAEQAIVAAREALAAGFPYGVNLDLMFGLPHQSLDDWKRSLDGVLSLRPQHLSLYCLTLEKGTPLEAWVRQGRMPEPDPDLAADMYEHAERVLADAGYHHYEISNWALPGSECRHNLVYWRDQPYLGVGPGAHSRLGDARFSGVKAPREYIARVKAWRETPPHPGNSLTYLLSRKERRSHPHPDLSLLRQAQDGAWPSPPIHREPSAQGRGEREDIAALPDGEEVTALLSRVPTVEGVEVRDRETAMSEMAFLGLRLLDGLDLAAFQRRHGVAFLDRYAAEVADLESLGLLERAEGVVRLTQRAHFLSNQAFVRFMP